MLASWRLKRSFASSFSVLRVNRMFGTTVPFDAAKIASLYPSHAAFSKQWSKAVDDAVMIWVYHDTSARALSPKIKKYVQAQSWFQDLALLET